ncbi:type 1 glutamine amidotransferase [Streptomyces yaizuensis]|uniref:Type 1 glutamine amidotransferase n=1 Tax=Streptomyces yaizuensis TaxID=2989713 RepID=A0ABQ5P5Z8_9ACTN|nr:type 1 glutamine amidotransferase [Streptomyces sp. YSPA8]GLF97910.1 type 1 glutamine amidotransferase [Streptomyces sp. YSPA8]
MTASASTPLTDRDDTPGRPRVLVIQHEDGTGPGLVGAELTAAGLELDLVHPWAGGRLPASPAGHAGLLVLGGSPGCDDDTAAPWLPEVRALIRRAVAGGVPLLGICLGGQLTAAALGGRVARGRRGPETGVVPLRRLPAADADALFAAVPDGAPAAQWHWDEIVELPPGAVALFTGDDCRHQAFRVGPRAWGVQFHPEVTAADVAGWARLDGPAVARAGGDPEAAVASVRAAEPVLREVWGRTTRAWARVVHAHHGRGGPAVNP